MKSEKDYSNCHKILYTNLCDKMAYAKSADPDQTAPEGFMIHNKATADIRGEGGGVAPSQVRAPSEPPQL